VVRGALPESLLDTYTAERRPVAAAVLANTLAQAALMRPDPQSGALRELMAQLLDNDDVNRTIGRMITGLVTRYDLGAARDEVGRLSADRPLDHPLDRPPGAADGAMLYDLMQDGAGVFLDASGGAQAARRVAGAARHIRCVAVETGPSLLIRPDACIAWAADGDDLAGLDAALARWFAPPSIHPRPA
jgi:hypothetical protein